MLFPSHRKWLAASLWLVRVSRPFPKRRRPPIRLSLEELEPRATPSVTVVPQQFATNQYTALSITEAQLLAGDSGTGTLKVSDLTQPAHAALVDNHNGTFTFTPEPSFTGSTTFQYGVGSLSASLTDLPLAADNPGHEVFSQTVSISGDTAVVGTPDQTTDGHTEQGGAYVFVRSGNTWSQQAVLSAADGAAGDHFGKSVSVSGDTIAIGSPNHTANGLAQAGTVYVFVRSGTTWTQQGQFTAPDAVTNLHFGNVASLSGDTVLAGVEFTDVPPLQGAAYVFTRSGSTWSQQARLTAADGGIGDRFGRALSLSGDTAVIDSSGVGSPADGVYAFVRSGSSWSQQAKLPNDLFFGASVSVNGDTAILGALGGAAEVFVRTGSTWSQQAKLTPAEGGSLDEFGIAVAVSGDTAVIGASEFDSPGGPANQAPNGAAYIFKRSGTTWTQQAMLVGPDLSGPGVEFGGAVALDGDTGVIGSSGKAFAVEFGSATATATVQVNPATAALTVSPARLPDATEGASYTAPTFTATGGAGSSITFQVSGILPPGLTFDAATARLVGTPVQAGTFRGIVVAAGDGQGGSGSQTYTLTVKLSGANGFSVPFPQTIYAPTTSKSEPNAANRAFIRGLYHSVLDRDVESDAALSYWETTLTTATTNPQQVGLPSGVDSFLFVAQGFWTSEEHRWRQIESYYHDFLGRDLDLFDAHNLSEREYWRNQFLLAGAQEADVIRGFLTSPEYLLKHQGDAALANVLNADLLAGAATAAHQQDWNSRLSSLDTQRVSLKGQSFATPEDYKAQLAAQLAAYADETAKTGVLFDVLSSEEYGQAVVNGFDEAMLRRSGTASEIQAILAQHDAAGQPLGLGTIAELTLASPEYRQNAAQSVV